jgi:hypothetical protein
MIVKDYMTEAEFFAQIWPEMEKAVADLDRRIIDNIREAEHMTDKE